MFKIKQYFETINHFFNANSIQNKIKKRKKNFKQNMKKKWKEKTIKKIKNIGNINKNSNFFFSKVQNFKFYFFVSFQNLTLKKAKKKKLHFNKINI